MGPGWAQPEEASWVKSVGCILAEGANLPRPQTLALGIWSVIALVEKDPELMHKVERYWLDIVRLTSTHRSPSRTNILEKVWSCLW